MGGVWWNGEAMVMIRVADFEPVEAYLGIMGGRPN